MTNSNIQSGRGIILSGNRQKAGTFIGIAKKRMRDMKQLMSIGNRQYMKRVHYLDRDCVWVHLTSIGSADFIRIHSCTEAEESECSLASILTPSGSNQVNFKYTYLFDDGSPQQRVYADTGGRYLSGGYRHLSGIFSGGQVNMNGTFIDPGEYTIKSYAQATVPVVFASSGLVSVSSWQEVVDVSSIAPKLQMIITTTSLGNDPVEVYVNGNLLATLNGTEYASMVLDYSVTIENTMTIDWVALGQDIRVASVFFRQYVCLGQTTDIITVT